MNWALSFDSKPPTLTVRWEEAPPPPPVGGGGPPPPVTSGRSPPHVSGVDRSRSHCSGDTAVGLAPDAAVGSVNGTSWPSAWQSVEVHTVSLPLVIVNTWAFVPTLSEHGAEPVLLIVHDSRGDSPSS